MQTRTMAAVILIFSAFCLQQTAVAAPKGGKGAKNSTSKAAPLLVPLSLEHLITQNKVIKRQDGKAVVLAYSPDGTRMAVAGDKTLVLLDGATSVERWAMKDLPGKVTDMCFSGDGAMLVTAGRDKEIYLWDASSGNPAGSVRLRDDVRSLSCSRKVVAASLDDKSIVLLDMNRMKQVRQTSASSEGGKSSGFKDWLKIFKERKKDQEQAALENALVKVLKQDNEEPFAIAFSPDGNFLAAGGKNRRILLWDVNKGAIDRILEGAEKEVTRLAFDPAGTRLAAVEDKKRIALWELGDPSRPQFLEPAKDDVLNLAFSKDGSVLAVAGKERLALWTLRKPREFYRFPVQDGEFAAVVFSPDGKTLAVAEEKQVRLWNVPGIVNLLTSPSVNEEIAALESERESKIKALSVSKGEFETSREFEARQKRVKAKEKALRKEYDERIRDVAVKREKELAQAGKRLYPSFVIGELGNYDADRGTFSASVGDRKVVIPVPAGQARRIAQHRNKVSFSGMIRYHSHEKAELVNASLVDEESGERFPFGVQVAGGPTADRPVGSEQTNKRRDLPDLRIAAVSFTESSGYGSLNAGDKGLVKVSINNGGSGAAEAVQIGIESIAAGNLPKGLNFPDKVFAGTVSPGENKSILIEITASEDTPAQEVRLKLTALDEDGFDSRPVELAFATRALVPPILQVTKIDIVDPEGKRVISKGKEVNVVATVQNSGGMARSVRAAIEIADPNIKLFSDGEVELGKIKPGETKKVSFSVAVTQRYSGDNRLPIDIVLNEERPQFSARLPARLVLNEEAPDIRLVRVEAKEPPQTPGPVDENDGLPRIAPAQRVFGENDIAVVIGIERYQTVPRSDFSRNDAQTIKASLLSLGFAERNIELLTDERATLSAIRKTVETWLPNRMKPGSRAFFYYSGHGAPDPATGEAFLVPYDGDPGYMNDTGYPMKRLFEKLGKTNALETIVVIDSCFSGSGGRSVISKGTRPLVMMTDSRQNLPSNMAVLTSTQGAQISTSYPEKEHGMFTWYFLKALRAGKSNVAEIYGYLKPLVEDGAKRQNVEQSPGISPDLSKVAGKYAIRK